MYVINVGFGMEAKSYTLFDRLHSIMKKSNLLPSFLSLFINL